jgi:putative membrane protein
MRTAALVYNETVRFILHIVLPVLANAAGLLAAARWIPGIALNYDPKNILALALVLTALNLILRPLLKLLIGPLIVLTLGAAIILVNAFILGFLDFLAPGLTIQGVPALLEATILLSAINVTLSLIFRA